MKVNKIGSHFTLLLVYESMTLDFIDIQIVLWINNCSDYKLQISSVEEGSEETDTPCSPCDCVNSWNNWNLCCVQESQWKWDCQSVQFAFMAWNWGYILLWHSGKPLNNTSILLFL